MNFAAIRVRMLTAALLPVFLVVVAVVSVFWAGRVGDLDAAHHQRAQLLVRQVAVSSEYGVFSANATNLQAIVNGVGQQADVRSVAVLDARGRLLAAAGLPIPVSFDAAKISDYVQQRKRLGVDALVEKIVAGSVSVDDLFSAQADAQPAAPFVLGYVVLELSRDGLKAREKTTLLIALGLGFAGLLVGGVLAIRLGERVVQPILSVSQRMERIGQGDFAVRKVVRDEDPLHELQVQLNAMATRLAWGREELEQRVADVTHALLLKKEEAESATLAKSRFLASASHDLRQPTHALGLFIARLGQLPMDEEMRQLVGNLDASVQAMQDLLDGLLDISRLEAGAVQAQVGPVDLGEMFSALRVALTPVATEKNLRLRIRPSKLWCLSDSMLLQRMVMNLANNALRYTERGTVHIACRSVEEGKSVRIDVSDSGIGISEAHQSDIFREFYQVGNASRDRSHGMGLGLNIVERSAKLLGHSVAVRSGLGCGTRFSIVVPLVVAPSVPLMSVAFAASVVPTLSGLRVLVVDDDDFSREAVQGLLASWECQVSAVASAQAAYDWLRAHAVPDLIVSDFRLGEGDSGLDVIMRLRAMAGREVPACLMSGDTDGGLMQAAKDAGLTLLHKPVRPAKLRSLVRHLIAGGAPQVTVAGL